MMLGIHSNTLDGRTRESAELLASLLGRSITQTNLVDDLLAFVVELGDTTFGTDVCLNGNDLSAILRFLGRFIELVGSLLDLFETASADNDLRSAWYRLPCN